MLAELRPKRGVGPPQRVEGDAIRERGPALAGEQLVGPLDRRIENLRPHAVALPRPIAEAAREHEVIGVAPSGGDLLLAKELRELRIE
ncbi:MAG: hypothetical protein GEU88_06380 [Solirubrobacterales bacterium]|nr:hypothetical protein [Solirubrobacterales bacterium]